MPLTRPSTVHYAFASSAGVGYINTLPDTPSGSALASWQQGFPPLTMTLAGGQPPYGQDFNGVLNALSANIQWWNAGGAPAYDSALSAAIGGYPNGAVLALNDGYSYVVSTVSNNITNPNTSMTGWAPFGGNLSGASRYAVDTGITNLVVLVLNPPASEYVNGLRVAFKASHTNTGATTLALNAVTPAPLVRTDGMALSASDLVAGTTYEAVYDSATGAWWLLSKVPSQNAAAATFFTNVTNPARGIGVVYTNTTGKPMLVIVYVQSTGANGNLFLTVNGAATPQAVVSWSASGAQRSVSIIVPPGMTYEATLTVSGATLMNWTEIY